MQKIEGLLTCDQCGASVTEDATETHLNWHATIDDAFGGAVKVMQYLEKQIEGLRNVQKGV